MVRPKEDGSNLLIDYIEKMTKKMVQTARDKNRDYAGDNACDPFRNFTLVEFLEVASTEQGILTRMTDKFSRIINLTKQTANVKDETIEDTLLDLANYCLILAAYLASHRRKGA